MCLRRVSRAGVESAQRHVICIHPHLQVARWSARAASGFGVVCLESRGVALDARCVVVASGFQSTHAAPCHSLALRSVSDVHHRSAS